MFMKQSQYFEHFKFEKKIHKIENHFPKAGVMFLVKSAKIENVMFS